MGRTHRYKSTSTLTEGWAKSEATEGEGFNACPWKLDFSRKGSFHTRLLSLHWPLGQEEWRLLATSHSVSSKNLNEDRGKGNKPDHSACALGKRVPQLLLEEMPGQWVISKPWNKNGKTHSLKVVKTVICIVTSPRCPHLKGGLHRPSV